MRATRMWLGMEGPGTVAGTESSFTPLLTSLGFS
jgi:hypothetical protein